MEDRLEQLLETALHLKATDIHFSWNGGTLEINMRGIAGLVRIPESADDERLFNYLQYQAHLDPSETGRPQCGSFSYFFRGTYYDFRFAVVESGRMKNGVLRILNCRNGISMEELTFDREAVNVFRGWLKRRSGLIVFTGLTGSGKTTTLYSLLAEVHGRTIFSLEDPIEAVQDNIVQLEISERTHFGYDEGIRQILRHNPDILLIGEIRDEKTARMTIRAALTGCLVVTSLHARNTATAISRLLELGVRKDELLDCAIGIVSQLLVPRKGGRSYTCVYDWLDEERIIAGDYRSHMAERLRQAERQGIIENAEAYR